MAEITRFELTKEFLDHFKNGMERKDNEFLISSLTGANVVDICELLEEFSVDEAKYVLDLLGNELTAEVINNMEEDTRTGSCETPFRQASSKRVYSSKIGTTAQGGI